MAFRNRPNSGVTLLPGDTTTLLYAPRVHPSPLTASLSGQNPVLGSLEVVITNRGAADANVDSITFTIQVGTGATLTPSTAAIRTDLPDTETWMVTGPSAPVTSGPAEYTLKPVVGTYATLAAGTSVVVQIYGFATNQTAGTTTVAIKEMLDQPPATFGCFLVTTFPPGFFFSSLAATVPSGSDLVPVAQVDTGSTVTLTWNSSVVDVNAYTILYSDPRNGQQTATPSAAGEWTSPPLTTDTVFTLVVTTTTAEGGEPLTASMSVAVGVQNPSLVAASVSAGTVAVAGSATVGQTVTAASATVTGTLTAAAATVSGAVTAAAATVNGAVTAQSLAVNGKAGITGTLHASSAVVDGPLTAASAHVDGGLNAQSAAISGALTIGQWSLQDDGEGNLLVSYQGGVIGQFSSAGSMAVGGTRVLRDSDPIWIDSPKRNAALNASTRFGGGAGAWVASAYWSGEPDNDSNLRIFYGHPY